MWLETIHLPPCPDFLWRMLSRKSLIGQETRWTPPQSIYLPHSSTAGWLRLMRSTLFYFEGITSIPTASTANDRNRRRLSQRDSSDRPSTWLLREDFDCWTEWKSCKIPSCILESDWQNWERESFKQDQQLHAHPTAPLYTTSSLLYILSS